MSHRWKIPYYRAEPSSCHLGNEVGPNHLSYFVTLFPISHTAPTISSSGTPFTQGHLGSLSKCDSKCDWGTARWGCGWWWGLGLRESRLTPEWRKERQSVLERLRACPQAALEKIDRLINLSELTGFKKMFTFPNEAVWCSAVRNENTGFKIWTSEEEAGEQTDRKWGRKVQILWIALWWFGIHQFQGSGLRLCTCTDTCATNLFTLVPRHHRWFGGGLNLSPLLSSVSWR